VRKKLDVRATVVDDKVFAAAMPVAAEAPVDFRGSAEIHAMPFGLTQGTTWSLVALVAMLNLRFASCDLVVDVDGQIHFLEANVFRQLALDGTRADLPISECIAEALTGHQS